MHTYNRENDLSRRLNEFVIDRFDLPAADYYSRLDQVGFTELKSVLGGINNIFTMKTTLAFVEWLSNRLEFNNHDQAMAINTILGTKPNANGYDVELHSPRSIIAEVKCNIPINKGKVYGSAQKEGITKDVISLIEGKTKSSIDPKLFMKFMVFLDTLEVREATKHLVKNMEPYNSRIKVVDEDTVLKASEMVYIVFVKF